MLVFIKFLISLYLLPSIPIPIFKVPEISKFFGIVIAAGAFGTFHLVAYGLQLSSILWASSVFMIWGVVYLFVGELVGSTSHYWWNALVTLGKTLSIK